ncbi:aspartate ammonia-lyase [Marinomonas mediterranea]|jgi:Aspartate ammonia-lyase|uniref:Fumarate hydratase class II n=1 Tax=Marinomonas mediterranea (strain ATCC 700492 / JCM 21426 / NBRC 103028 / MMB-1) TaxID=717774 RepID=F2JY72_MARM1|nr:aspartate ammonia-lyase [Marinomonas mediterranea]ADZ90808.1 Fumarate hydratase class II [Marinomonas mediterranea MMB-1]WCN08848.1 aspartate ammonia-lyase [Marinomonas mediterranea]WCN12893.1 aspartate ammonia-lyase [Marinomonas mediterranea]WCN16961.1 aspartate ammonia-lyase [Marinomonas mediterranea MMB-1]
MNTRSEYDLLGTLDVPADAFYGIQTLRAANNFSITGVAISHFPELIKAMAMVKAAAAHTNFEYKLLEEHQTNAILSACQELIDGHYHNQFIVDVIQGGAGTSTNMNANEVIANIALTKMGYQKGDYKKLHPNDHVNRSQSTNDAYPTAASLSIQFAADAFVPVLSSLKASLEEKGREFASVLKMGRTQLQDAVPMTLGQEFDAFAVNLGEDIDRIQEACTLLCEVNLGGTAIGTGINTPAGYAKKAVDHLAKISGKPVVPATNLVEATSDMGAFVFFSGILKRLATKLSKMSNDLRLLSSGPRTGFGEIKLPEMQPGSSIMPGKVNPVIPEAMNQTAYQVIASDLAVTLAAEAGQLQLNAMEPMIIYNLLNSIKMLKEACHMMEHRCIRGIEANVDACAAHVENSIGIITALVPHIGYANSSRIARNALMSGATIKALILEEKLLTEAQLNELLKPENMISPTPSAQTSSQTSSYPSPSSISPSPTTEGV